MSRGTRLAWSLGMLLVLLPALALDPEAHVPTAARCAPDTVDLALYLDTRLAIGGVTFGAVSAQRSCLVGESCAGLEALSATCAVFPCGVVPQADDLVPGWTVTRATPVTPVGKADRLGVRLDLDNPSRRAQATLWCLADDRDSGENLGWGCSLELMSGRGTVRVVHDDDVLSYTDETGAVATMGSRWSRTGGAARGWRAGIHDP